jgi:surfeit locus 1 family protein
MTPFRTAQGFTVLVNRGFVPSELRDPGKRKAGQVAGETGITGLIRMTEPKGGFLRTNEPAAGRWYSRDVAAIAAARGLSDVAPFFIDADSAPHPGGWPIGGLTVIAFPNNHMVYALTWFGLAAMLIGMAAFVLRDEWRFRRGFLDDEGRVFSGNAYHSVPRG